MMIGKRIVAWVVDWLLSGIPAMVYSAIFRMTLKTSAMPTYMKLIFIVVVLSYPLIFVFRDVIFKGRSIGKRIFGLHVIDKSTNALPTKKKLIIRNLFFFAYPAEAILLIIKNESIGDIASETTIVSR